MAQQQIIVEINRLYQHFGVTSKDVTREMIESTIEIASSYPPSLVRRVVVKFIRGEVPGQSLEFPPKPPMFSQALKAEPYAPEEQAAKREEIRRSLGGRPALTDEREREAPTPEGKAKVAKLLAAFRQQTQINRDAERRRPSPEPMTAAKAEYWRKIMAIKDAKEVTEEHLSARRRIETEIGASA